MVDLEAFVKGSRDGDGKAGFDCILLHCCIANSSEGAAFFLFLLASVMGQGRNWAPVTNKAGLALVDESQSTSSRRRRKEGLGALALPTNR